MEYIKRLTGVEKGQETRKRERIPYFTQEKTKLNMPDEKLC